MSRGLILQAIVLIDVIDSTSQPRFAANCRFYNVEKNSLVVVEVWENFTQARLGGKFCGSFARFGETLSLLISLCFEFPAILRKRWSLVELAQFLHLGEAKLVFPLLPPFSLSIKWRTNCAASRTNPGNWCSFLLIWLFLLYSVRLLYSDVLLSLKWRAKCKLDFYFLKRLL